MAKVTLFFAVLLIALGMTGYLGTGSAHPTALIPAWIGLALGFGGLLAISPNASRRKLFMHINVTIGLIGFVGALVEALRGYGAARSAGLDPDMIALTSKLIMAGLLFIYVNLCIKSFVEARRARKLE